MCDELPKDNKSPCIWDILGHWQTQMWMLSLNLYCFLVYTSEHTPLQRDTQRIRQSLSRTHIPSHVWGCMQRLDILPVQFSQWTPCSWSCNRHGPHLQNFLVDKQPSRDIHGQKANQVRHITNSSISNIRFRVPEINERTIMLTAIAMENPADEIVELINTAAFDDSIVPGEEWMQAKCFAPARCVTLCLIQRPTGKWSSRLQPVAKGWFKCWGRCYLFA